MKTANERGRRHHSRELLVSGAVVSLVALAACTGTIGDASNGFLAGSGASGNGSQQPGATTGGSGSGSTASGQSDPGTVPVHRLNALEYDNTINDLFGLSQNVAQTSFLPDEKGNTFDNQADAFTMSDAEFSQYFNAATALTEQVFGDPKLSGKILNGCADSSCLQTVINNFGARAYRRPLAADEVTRFTTLAGYVPPGATADFQTSVKMVVEMILSSVPFLYRVEFDPDPASTTPHVVGNYEIASRLSYLLWSSMPDKALFDDAAAGKLAQADTTALAAQVDRMLSDPKASNFISSFAGQWLGVRDVASHQVEPTAFKAWSEPVRQAMMQEQLLYFNEFVVGNLPWTQFLTAKVNFVNGPLAALYGVKSVPATQTTMTKVTGMDPNRVGFMGLGGFLAQTSFTYRTVPTLRGKWVLNNLLCENIPQPPPGIPPLDPAGTAATSTMAQSENVAARLAQHRNNPGCATCHKRLDPVGLGLENFDGIGVYRTKYGDGSVIDPSGVLPDGSTFKSLSELAALLSVDASHGSDPAKGGLLQELTNCASQQLLNYAISRPLNSPGSDDPYLAQIQAAWAKDTTWSIKALLKAVIVNDTFRFRHGGI